MLGAPKKNGSHTREPGGHISYSFDEKWPPGDLVWVSVFLGAPKTPKHDELRSVFSLRYFVCFVCLIFKTWLLVLFDVGVLFFGFERLMMTRIQ